MPRRHAKTLITKPGHRSKVTDTLFVRFDKHMQLLTDTGSGATIMVFHAAVPPADALVELARSWNVHRRRAASRGITDMVFRIREYDATFRVELQFECPQGRAFTPNRETFAGPDRSPRRVPGIVIAADAPLRRWARTANSLICAAIDVHGTDAPALATPDQLRALVELVSDRH